MIRIEIERRGPLYVAGGLTLLCLWKGVEFYRFAAVKALHIEVLYSSLFDISTIAAAFLFAFFTFARTTESEFLTQLRKTNVFRRFMSYLVVSIISTSVAALVTVPMMIAEPTPTQLFDVAHIIVAAWTFVAGFALAATYRSARQFIAFALADSSHDAAVID